VERPVGVHAGEHDQAQLIGRCGHDPLGIRAGVGAGADQCLRADIGQYPATLSRVVAIEMRMLDRRKVVALGSVRPVESRGLRP